MFSVSWGCGVQEGTLNNSILSAFIRGPCHACVAVEVHQVYLSPVVVPFLHTKLENIATILAQTGGVADDRSIRLCRECSCINKIIFIN